MFMASMVGFKIEPYRRKYLDGYMKRMSQDNLHPLWDDHVASVLKDQGFEIEESPRSVYKVEKLYEALNKYDPNAAPSVDINNEDIQAGISLARACFARNGQDKLEVAKFTPDFIHRITSNPSGSSGLTAWGVKKRDAEYRAFERGLQVIRGEKRPEPCIAFARTQFNDKTRLVWGYPYSMTAVEGLFARPLIEKFKSGVTPMAFGMSTLTLGAKLRVASYHKRYAYSLDVKSFDSAASAPLIHEAFKILRTWFDMEELEGTSGVPLRTIWKAIRDYFIFTPIVMPDGNIYKGKRSGVPSGSYFTQIVDSIVNTIYVGALSHKFALYVDKTEFFVLGDDVLFWSDRDIELSTLTEFGSRVFNVTFNADKSEKFRWDEVIHYLGRDWDKGVPTLSVDEILKRMTQPERFRKYSRDPKVREKQVWLLLFAYAAVYKDAYPIVIKCFGEKRKWYTSQTNLEAYVAGLSDDVQNADDFLTGLQRYQKKYVNEEIDEGLVPLAVQFYK